MVKREELCQLSGFSASLTRLLKFLSISFYIVLMSHQLTKKLTCRHYAKSHQIDILFPCFKCRNYLQLQVYKYISICHNIQGYFVTLSVFCILETLDSFNECISDNICNYSMKTIVTLTLHWYAQINTW